MNRPPVFHIDPNGKIFSQICLSFSSPHQPPEHFGGDEIAVLDFLIDRIKVNFLRNPPQDMVLANAFF